MRVHLFTPSQQSRFKAKDADDVVEVPDALASEFIDMGIARQAAEPAAKPEKPKVETATVPPAANAALSAGGGKGKKAKGK